MAISRHVSTCRRRSRHGARPTEPGYGDPHTTSRPLTGRYGGPGALGAQSRGGRQGSLEHFSTMVSLSAWLRFDHCRPAWDVWKPRAIK